MRTLRAWGGKEKGSGFTVRLGSGHIGEAEQQPFVGLQFQAFQLKRGALVTAWLGALVHTYSPSTLGGQGSSLKVSSSRPVWLT